MSLPSEVDNMLKLADVQALADARLLHATSLASENASLRQALGDALTKVDSLQREADGLRAAKSKLEAEYADLATQIAPVKRTVRQDELNELFMNMAHPTDGKHTAVEGIHCGLPELCHKGAIELAEGIAAYLGVEVTDRTWDPSTSNEEFSAAVDRYFKDADWLLHRRISKSATAKSYYEKTRLAAEQAVWNSLDEGVRQDLSNHIGEIAKHLGFEVVP